MQRDILWHAVDTLGLEHCAVRVADEGVVLDGLVIAVVDGTPLRLAYTVACDSAWRTREVAVRALDTDRALVLAADGEGAWRDGDGRPLPALDGCLHVDITVTPSTNTLPIRHLGLAPGQHADIRVVYVEAPTLSLEPGNQRYTCLAPERYRFQALDSGFEADLTIDADGLVVAYPGLFTRAWPAMGHAAPHQ